MDIINDVNIIESDIEDTKEKCNKIQCNPLYDAFNAVIKLFFDLLKLITKRKSI